MKKKTSLLLLLSTLVFAITPFLTFSSASIMKDKAQAAGKMTLPVVGSYANLKTLLKKELYNGPVYYDGKGVESAAAQKAVPASAAAPSGDHSTTNVQVEGVDEADIIKTDGTFIYQATNQQVVITKAYPANEMKVVNRLAFSDSNFSPMELYVDAKYLVVIGQKEFGAIPYDDRRYAYPHRMESAVIAKVYDNRDKTKGKLLREVEIAGNYLSSRKIGSTLYLIGNQFINTNLLHSSTKEIPAPIYRDSASKSGYYSIGYESIRYFPEAVNPNYLMVASVTLDQPQKKADVNAYLGSGQNVYASSQNLYVAVQQDEYDAIKPMPKKPFNKPFMPPQEEPQRKTNTVIYKFAMAKGVLDYTGKGSVPGRILNQFSMDESNGYFRIATTTGESWRSDENTSKNNLYILDNQLKISGKLENIAPGEKIYSVRFMGNRAYMVTFKKVDPLFVIDVKNPKAPRILGALKIPGYSDYLHPYDENHIIGFGKDTIETKDAAYYQGMKVAMFDVSNVNRPLEKFKEIIGDRGTDSELLRNHKALLFSKEKNLLAFPVTLMKVNNKNDGNGKIAYGEFAFQGAYVYQIDLKKGFQLKAKISHLSNEDQLKAGSGWYNSEKNVQRILYIGDMLYTVSQGQIKANRLNDFKEIKTLLLHP